MQPKLKDIFIKTTENIKPVKYGIIGIYILMFMINAFIVGLFYNNNLFLIIEIMLGIIDWVFIIPLAQTILKHIRKEEIFSFKVAYKIFKKNTKRIMCFSFIIFIIEFIISGIPKIGFLIILIVMYFLAFLSFLSFDNKKTIFKTFIDSFKFSKEHFINIVLIDIYYYWFPVSIILILLILFSLISNELMFHSLDLYYLINMAKHNDGWVILYVITLISMIIMAVYKSVYIKVARAIYYDLYIKNNG